MRASLVIVCIGVALFLDGACRVEAAWLTHGRGLNQFCHPERSRDIGLAIGAIYTHPEIDGVKVDYCLSRGSGCGKKAADAFCEMNGHGFADTYVVWNFAGIQCGATVTIKSREQCTDDCRGFRIISCAGEALRPSSLLGSILGVDREGNGKKKDEESDMKDNIKEEPVAVEAAVQPGGLEIIEATVDQTSPAEILQPKSSIDSAEEPADPIPIRTFPNGDGSKKASEVDEVSETTKGEGLAQESNKEHVEGNKEDKKDGQGDNQGLLPQSSGQPENGRLPTLEAPPSQAEGAKDSNKKPSKGDVMDRPKIADDGSIEIDHPDLGDVKFPGEEGANVSKSSKRKKNQQSQPGGQNPGSGTQEDAVSCQTRGSESSIAAARLGCSVVIDKCATNEAALKSQQEAINGSAGRRLTQKAVERGECRDLFSSECRAAAFNNVQGLCSILMGKGPNTGEEQEGCADAEQARSLFKASVKDSCEKFLNGAFP